ncbi:MAG: hypothetical protein M3H12_08390, partial [Chromatiales bacterium]
HYAAHFVRLHVLFLHISLRPVGSGIAVSRTRSAVFVISSFGPTALHVQSLPFCFVFALLYARIPASNAMVAGLTLYIPVTVYSGVCDIIAGLPC